MTLFTNVARDCASSDLGRQRHVHLIDHGPSKRHVAGDPRLATQPNRFGEVQSLGERPLLGRSSGTVLYAFEDDDAARGALRVYLNPRG